MRHELGGVPVRRAAARACRAPRPPAPPPSPSPRRTPRTRPCPRRASRRATPVRSRLLLHPVAGQIQPEREPGPLAVAAEAPLDRRVLRLAAARASRTSAASTSRARAASSGRGSSASRARRRTGRSRAAPAAAPPPRRRAAPGRSSASRSTSPLATERGERPQVRRAVAGARDLAVERLVRGRHRLGGRERAAAVGRRVAEMLDERGRHLRRQRPRAVRRADRLHDVLEDGRAAQHPAGARRRPGEVARPRRRRRRTRERSSSSRSMWRTVASRRSRSRTPAAPPSSSTAAWPRFPARTRTVRARPPPHRQRRLQRPRLLVEALRRQRRDAVRRERAPEVDRLAAAADEAQLAERWSLRERRELPLGRLERLVRPARRARARPCPPPSPPPPARAVGSGMWTHMPVGASISSPSTVNVAWPLRTMYSSSCPPGPSVCVLITSSPGAAAPRVGSERADVEVVADRRPVRPLLGDDVVQVRCAVARHCSSSGG